MRGTSFLCKDTPLRPPLKVRLPTPAANLLVTPQGTKPNPPPQFRSMSFTPPRRPLYETEVCKLLNETVCSVGVRFGFVRLGTQFHMRL